MTRIFYNFETFFVRLKFFIFMKKLSLDSGILIWLIVNS